jgi:hypothetical protein
MLTTKTFFADVASGTNPNGENVLFYNPTDRRIAYSINPVGALSNTYSYTTSLSSVTSSSTSYVTYFTSASMAPGLYFVIVCYTYNRTASTSLTVRVLNNSNSSTFGNLDTIDIQLTSIRYPGVTSGISRLTNANTFSFQFNRPAGTTNTMLAGNMVCFEVAP